MSDDLRGKIVKTLAHHLRQSQRVLRSLQWRMTRPPARQPVFVVGCSRAGTTVVYKVLSEAQELGSLSRETHDFWDALHPVAARGWANHALDRADASDADRARVAHHFFTHTGLHRWVDKNNQNGLCVPYLDALFPDARFVFVTRHPGDNLASLLEGWCRPGEFATWSAALPARVAFEGRQLPWCFFLPVGWRDIATRPLEEICAYQYQTMNEALLEAEASLPPERWCRLPYEDLLREPDAALRRVFQALDLGFDSAVARRCKAALGQPYNAFSAIAENKWQRSPHQARIARVLPDLAPLALRLGYSLST